MTACPGMILAGGLARRMGGGDKGLRRLGGRPVLAWVIDRVRPQVSNLALNANGDATRFADWELPVVPDPVQGNPGPLAGVLAAMDWALAEASGASHVATIPCDAPFLPTDLVGRMLAAAGGRADRLVTAVSGGREHPVVGLWPLALRADLRRALVDEGVRKVDAWTARHDLERVAFAAPDGGPDPFFNANRAEDLSAAEAWIAAG